MKRVISLLLALTMALGLAACGKPNAGSTSGEGSEAPRKLTLGIPMSSTVTYENNWFHQFMEDRLDCEIELVFFAADSGDRKSQLTTMVAGKEKLPDILFNFSLNADEIRLYGNDGYLVDMAPYFDDPDWELAKEHGWHEKMVQYSGEDTRVYALNKNRDADGHMYYWPSACPSETDLTVAMPFINKSWLDKLGLEIPTNRDELVEVLRAFKTQDPNGNGIADEIPMVGSNTLYCADAPSWLHNTFGEYVYDGYFYTYNEETGKIDVPYNTEKYRDGLRFMNQLVDEGLLSTLTWTLKETAEMTSLWTPAEGDTTVGLIVAHPTEFTTPGDPDILQYVPLPPFEGSYIPQRTKSVSSSYYITTDCENFELACEFLMSYCDLDVIRASRRGEEGVDWVEKTDLKTGMPMIDPINPIYGNPGDRCWGITGPAVCRFGDGSPIVGGIFDPADLEKTMDMEDPEGYRGGLLGATIDANVPYAQEHNPKFFYHVIYNNDEVAENGNSFADLKAYVKEARAKFATGMWDPDSEADWNNYIQTMENMGLSTLIKNTQAAIDRMEGANG